MHGLYAYVSSVFVLRLISMTSDVRRVLVVMWKLCLMGGKFLLVLSRLRNVAIGW